MIIKVTLFCASVLLLLSACDSTSSGSTASTAQDDCMAAVKRTLKDPDSAKFQDLVALNRESATSSAGMVTYQCFGKVNAKNALGGYVGFKEFKLFTDGDVQISN